MLNIIKYGNKNFQHEATDYEKAYGANDITIIFDGNYVKLRSFSGRIVFDKEGYLFSDVRVFDGSGASAESFPNVVSLKARLIALGYPFAGGVTTDILNEVEWVNITGDPTTNSALVSYVESETSEIDGGTA